MQRNESHDLNYLVWYLAKTAIDVAGDDGDPEPLVFAADFLLHAEAEKNKKFQKRRDATNKAAEIYRETDGESTEGLAPRSASWERLRAYFDVAKDERLVKKHKLTVDLDDEAKLQGTKRRSLA